jgi:hypothetical protein
MGCRFVTITVVQLIASQWLGYGTPKEIGGKKQWSVQLEVKKIGYQSPGDRNKYKQTNSVALSLRANYTD